MVFQRAFAVLCPFLLLGSVTLTVAVGPQWAPPVGVGVLAVGDSMEPSICAGDVVVYRDGTEIHEGDVITFHTDTAAMPIITHRVVAVTEHGYLTRGDNNPLSDFPWIGYVEDEDVIGKVVAVASIRECTDRSGVGRVADVGRNDPPARGIRGGG